MHIYLYIVQGIYIRYILCSVFSKTVVTLLYSSTYVYSVHLCVVSCEGLHCLTPFKLWEEIFQFSGKFVVYIVKPK